MLLYCSVPDFRFSCDVFIDKWGQCFFVLPLNLHQSNWVPILRFCSRRGRGWGWSWCGTTCVVGPGIGVLWLAGGQHLSLRITGVAPASASHHSERMSLQLAGGMMAWCVDVCCMLCIMCYGDTTTVCNRFTWVTWVAMMDMCLSPAADWLDRQRDWWRHCPLCHLGELSYSFG